MIDSHHHLWNYSAEGYPWISEEMALLRQDFTIADLRQTLQGSGTGDFELLGTVAVQAQQTLTEADWLVQCSLDAPLIKGVVGWVPLAAEESTLVPILERLSSNACFKGVRHVVQDEPDEKFLLRNDFSRGVSFLQRFGLVYDILIYAHQLPMAAAFVDRHPNQTFVLDHIAKPTIQSSRFDENWAANIRELAKRTNVACKFSGVVTEIRDPHWDLGLLQPYWDTVLDAFGPQRLMFGSDWPVCLLRARYEQWLSVVKALTAELSSSERELFWQENAIKYYNLNPSHRSESGKV